MDWVVWAVIAVIAFLLIKLVFKAIKLAIIVLVLIVLLGPLFSNGAIQEAVNTAMNQAENIQFSQQVDLG